MDRIQSLEVFIAVAEAGSFSAGARAVGLSAPSVTRGINALEARLGTRLLTRTTRQVRLTDTGAAYLEDARQILAHLKSADEAASGAASTPVGTLRITCPNEFGRIHITPILTQYLDAYPDVKAELVMVDRVVNIVEEGFDIALRIAHLPPSELSAVRVGTVRRVVCASPGYFAANGLPQHPHDLAGHKIICNMPLSPHRHWNFGAAEDQMVLVHPRMAVTSVAAALSAARSGWGLTRALSYQIGDDLKAGTLQTVLEDFEPEPVPVHLVHVEGRRAAAKVRTFLEFAKARLRRVPMLN